MWKVWVQQEAEEEVRGEAECLEEGQEAEAGLSKAELILHRGLKVVLQSRGQWVEVWDKGEVGEAEQEPSHSSIWRKGGRGRSRRGRQGEGQGPCHARGNP